MILFEKVRKNRHFFHCFVALSLISSLLISSCGKKEYEVYGVGGAQPETAAQKETAATGPFGGAGSDTGAEKDGGEDEGGSIFGRVESRKKKDDGGGSSDGGGGTDSGGSGGSGSSGGTDSGGSGSGLEYEDGFVVNEGPNTAYQLTEEDIQKMNENKAVIVRSNNGYVSTLVGRWYDKRIAVKPNDIQTFEAAINSLNGLATLLGFRAGTEFFAAYGSQDQKGYTYLTYQQRYGGITVENATMHLVIDPEGCPCAVSCSFSPELGFSSETPSMTKSEAVSIVRGYAAQCGFPDLRIYEEATVQACIPVYTQIHNCYVVFSDNPDGVSGFESLRYYKWFVTMEQGTDYQIMMILPSSSLTVSADTSYYPTDEYFENLETVTWSGPLDLMNDGVKQVEINVARNKQDGRYYMIDPVRKIAVADCYQFLYGSGLQFLSNSENRWDERDLAAMYNYEAAYDAYAKIGIKAPDGFSTPILLLRNYCDQNGEPVNNACYMAQFNGWFTFCYSTANNYCYDLDVIGHEYTHAVTESCLVGNNYQNDAGAINEAYSDIMGNLIEYMAGRTDDTLWLAGENSDEAIRQMSAPVRYHQPDCIGGPFYVPTVDVPDQNFNDCGGVHTNSGIVNYAAYLMYESGLDYATMFDLFYTSMNVLTPANSFEDVYAALIFSARSRGYTKFEDNITEAFRKTGVTGMDRAAQEIAGSIREGYGTLHLDVNDYGNTLHLIQVYDAATQNYVTAFWPNRTLTARMTLPEGYYMLQLVVLDRSTGQTGAYIYDNAYGWAPQMGSNPVVYVTPGETTDLIDFQGA